MDTLKINILNLFKKNSSNIFIFLRNTPININNTNGKTTFKENIKLSTFHSFLLCDYG